MAYIYDIADVWAASGTTFTGIKLNVTDTASASGSLLMDLQVGGTSQFSVRKNGISVLSSLLLGGGTYGGDANWWSGNNLNIASASVLSFGPADTVLRRDAANTLAQRNGVNAQAFNLYNTYTDASNFERGFMRFVSNVLEIGAQAAGTGLNRGLELRSAHSGPLVQLSSNTWDFCNSARDYPTVRVQTGTGVNVSPTFQFTFNSATYLNTGAADTGLARSAAGVAKITNGSTGGGSLEMQEVTAPAAPAANNARIYAEDDGSGKTRLMARFATGAAVQIAIEP